MDFKAINSWKLCFLFFRIICLFLAVLGVHGCSGFSLAVVSGGCFLVLGLGLFTAGASCVGEHGLSGAWVPVVAAYGFSSCGSWALECCSQLPL